MGFSGSGFGGAGNELLLLEFDRGASNEPKGYRAGDGEGFCGGFEGAGEPALGICSHGGGAGVGGESKEESRVEGPDSRAEASGMLPSSFALHGSGVTEFAGGASDHSKS